LVTLQFVARFLSTMANEKWQSVYWRAAETSLFISFWRCESTL